MLTVTERASRELKQVLDTVERETNQCLRLITDPQGNFRLTLDIPRKGDQVVKHGEEAVLLIEPRIAQYLEGAVLDVEDTPTGPSLVISR
jgi:Fe-S cluster assembly iron-binding protein IscA